MPALGCLGGREARPQKLRFGGRPGLALHRTVGVPRRAKASPEVSPLATLRRNSPSCGIARRSSSLHGSPLHSRAGSEAALSPIDGSFQQPRWSKKLAGRVHAGG